MLSYTKNRLLVKISDTNNFHSPLQFFFISKWIMQFTTIILTHMNENSHAGLNFPLFWLILNLHKRSPHWCYFWHTWTLNCQLQVYWSFVFLHMIFLSGVYFCHEKLKFLNYFAKNIHLYWESVMHTMNHISAVVIYRIIALYFLTYEILVLAWTLSWLVFRMTWYKLSLSVRLFFFVGQDY